jgi:Leucine-rich repeat (LRR) protein
MTELTDLNLSNNLLTSVPHFPPSLLFLHLKSNHLPSLPQELSQLSSLLELDASLNNISTLPKELFTTSPGLVQLKNLNLSSNGLQLLVPEICELPSLKVG